MRWAGVVVMLALLAACGNGVEPAETSVRTIERATVTDVPGGDGPILCEGPVAESAPPQCEGPVISNWDWSKVWGAAGEEGARFGDFCLEGRDTGDEFVLTALPRPVGTCDRKEYVAYATVIEDGGTFGPVHGPQLCLGPALESSPIQCGGPDIPNWDWDLVDGWTKRAKTTDGLYTLHGVYADGDFTQTRPPVPLKPGDQPTNPSAFERDFTTPCPEPSGGWFPERRPTLSQADLNRASSFADSIPGYAELWLDQSPSANPDNDPNELILNVRVTEDLDSAEAAMRTVWKGALCISRAEHTAAELQRIHEQAAERAGELSLGSYTADDHVIIEVIVDEDGKLQKELDAKYGEGVVRVSSALREAPPGM